MLGLTVGEITWPSACEESWQALLQTAVLGSSLLYHHDYERPGVTAKIEGALAKALFLYGSAQTYLSPSEPLLLANAACLVATLGCYVATNVNKGLYERWHPIGLHVVPGIWSALVAAGHETLLPPWTLSIA